MKHPTAVGCFCALSGPCFEVPKIRWVFPKIGVPPKLSLLIGFSIMNHPFWGTTIFGNIQMSSPGLSKEILVFFKGNSILIDLFDDFF